jgi:hypothetical protein
MHDGLIDRQRWDESLVGLDTVWVGVHCDEKIASSRESKRGDRPSGLASRTATSSHRDIHYDVKVDTSVMDLDTAVNHIVRGLRGRWPIDTSSKPTGPTAQPPISAWTKDGGVSRPRGSISRHSGTSSYATPHERGHSSEGFIGGTSRGHMMPYGFGRR